MADKIIDWVPQVRWGNDFIKSWILLRILWISRVDKGGVKFFKGTRLVKTGNARFRTAFFMPALVALAHNPIIKNMAARMSANGKNKMTIVGAAMRKLVHLAFGVLKNGIPFDPDYLVNVQISA